MESRKWDELPADCLVNVLGRVGFESLLLDVAFVCKSWYQASLNPLCWKQLDFSSFYCDTFISRFESRYRLYNLCVIKLVKSVISRSAGCATHVELPSWYGEQELSHIGDKCPALKTLVLHLIHYTTMFDRPCVIGRFEKFYITRYNFDDILNHFSNCQNLTALNLVCERNDVASIGGNDAMALVRLLPNLKTLTLKWVWIKRGNLIKLMNGFVDLVHLDVSDCYGFDGNDEQLLKLASHIPSFNSSGSVVCNFGDEDDDSDHSDYSSDSDGVPL